MRTCMHVNIVLKQAYVTVFIGGRDFAEYQTGQSWTASVNANNS